MISFWSALSYKIAKRSEESFGSIIQSNMEFYVYILYSHKLNRFYIGQTTNLANRLEEHNKGQSSYTSKGTPWILIWSTQKMSLGEIKVLEKKLKNLSRERKIKFIQKYHQGLVDNELLNELSKL